MLGSLLNQRYRIEAELGRGGMSVVYRGQDVLLGRPIAVKVLQTVTDHDGWDSILREARSAAQLNHPNIVSVYDVGEAADADGETVPFIVMELVEGVPLNHWDRRGLKDVVAVAKQVCEALAHAHSHDVIHRDLKPENILVTPAGTVKLTDFGLAQSVASRLSTSGALVGTVFYISPEQAMGRRVDGRADLYALGVVLYEAVTGQLPFSGENALSVISLHLNAPPVPPRAHRADLPPAFEHLILQLLSKRPDERPVSARDVGRALDGVLAEATQPGAELSLLDRIVRGRFVGREAELREAIAHWQRAASGEGHVLLITGEPGIGKTRLVREMTAHVEATGGQILSGECYAEGGAPFAPFAEAIRQSLTDLPGLGLPENVLVELITFAPDLELRFPDLPPNPPLDVANQQQRAFEGFALFAEAQARRRPLLLFLDDAHWADSASLQLLHYLARRVRNLPVLIVATYREIELDENPPLGRLVLDLNRERLAVRIKLGRLSREQTQRLLQAMFAEDISLEFLDGIYRESEGNPFFIEEITKTVVDSGKLRFEDGRWHRPGVSDLEIPQSIRGAILSRVTKLPETAREAMLMASILGREFEFETLQRATAIPEEGLISALEAAQQAQLIHEARRNGDIVFSFDHALIPASLADSVSALRRKRLHRLAAEAIEAARPDAWEVLAFHWIQAGEEELGRVFSLRAADRAYASLARSEAARHYRAALERWPADDPAGKADTLAKLGDCLLLVVEEGTYDAYRQARDLYRDLGNTVQTGEMERRIGRIYWESGDRSMAMKHYTEALKLLEGRPPTPELARALSSMSQMYMLASDYDQAVVWGERALELAATVGAEDVQVHALNNLGSSYTGLGDTVKGDALLTESLQRALKAGLPHDAARAYTNLADMYFERGDYDKAEGWYQDGSQFARQFQILGFASYFAWAMARIAWRRGRWTAWLQLSHTLEESALTNGLYQVLEPARQAASHIDLGRPKEALEELEASLSPFESNDEPQTILPHLTELVRAAAEAEEPERGRQAVERILTVIDSGTNFSSFAGPALLAVLLWLRDGGVSSLATSSECLARLVPLHAQQNSPLTTACLAEGRALAAEIEGQPGDAATSFEQAAQRWKDVGRPLDQARALVNFAAARAQADKAVADRAPLLAAKEILDGLAAQLSDSADKESFARSRLATRVDELLRQGT
ncbi:MAG TPA: protein kinase [Anaerolineales bacterium]|nr:protein kinase [Anaerolineales bacterium]